jgi:hypothetical protein
VEDNLAVRHTYWVQIEYVNLYFKIDQDESVLDVLICIPNTANKRSVVSNGTKSSGTLFNCRQNQSHEAAIYCHVS